MEAVFPSNRNVFVNEFSIPGGGNRLSVYPVDTRRKLKPIIPSSGKLIIITIFVTTRRLDFSSNRNLL